MRQKIMYYLGHHSHPCISVHLIIASLRQSLSVSLPSSYRTSTHEINNSLSYIVHGKHKNLISPIHSCPRISKTHYLYVPQSSRFSTFYQTLDKMSQRNQHRQDTDFHFVHHLLKPSNGTRHVLTVRTVHCLVLKLGFLLHLPTSTTLLAAYSRVSDICSSWGLFNETCDRDVVFWNAMISACKKNHCFNMALDFFVEMIKEGTGFDSTTLLIVVSTLSRTKYLKRGNIFHTLSIKSGMLSDCCLCNALVDMYAKCGDLNSSACVFAEMDCRDTVSWNTVMSGCLSNDHPEQSLLYFKEMNFSGERADCVSLSSAIAGCTCLGELSHGQVIHGWGIKFGYEESNCISVANSLISLYSKCGDIEAAETVFQDMRHKDVVSWNAIINGIASNGKIKEAFDLLIEMQLMGFTRPDATTVVTIISLCAEFMLLREGRSVHGYAMRRVMGCDEMVMNSLMNFYSKCNCIEKAQLLFSIISIRDLVTWNTMISGYIQNEDSKKAQSLFKEMLYFSSEFSTSTLFAILPSCNSLESLKFGKSIHCWQLKVGFSNDNLVVNSLMDMYINCGDLMAAFPLLQRISLVGDTSCWNTVIVACTRNGHFQEAFETFNMMRQKGNASHDSVTLFNVILASGMLELASQGKSLHGLALKSLIGSDSRVLNVLITMYSRCSDIESARLVFILSSDRNLCSWNCMISAFSQNKAEIRALDWFRLLEFKPNDITIVSVLSACSQLGVLRHGREIHGCVIRMQFQDNPFISAALLDMYSNCGRLDIACKIFRNAGKKSNAAWNSMISAYGFHGEGRKAIEVFHEMCNYGIRPTKSTFISLLSACSHTGLVNEGLWYYNHMREYEVEPVTEHNVHMVEMLGRACKRHEAYEFIMNKSEQPKPGVWGAMLSACNYHGDMEMGKKVAQLLFELEPENVGYYISLANMCVASGQWKDAVELREIIHHKKLRKTAGYCLIDVGQGHNCKRCNFLLVIQPKIDFSVSQHFIKNIQTHWPIAMKQNFGETKTINILRGRHQWMGLKTHSKKN